MNQNQGLKIAINADYKVSGEIEIVGELSTFVNCGSQYAIWFQFPSTILYTLKDLDTGNVFESIDDELSISWDGNDVYNSYAKEPCNTVVTKSFSTPLSAICFRKPSQSPISNFELHASYLGHTSNLLTIKDAHVVLTTF